MTEHHGEKLEEFLRIKNISRSDLAEKLGVSRGTLYLWFRKRNLPEETLDLLSDKIGFKVHVPNLTSVQEQAEPMKVEEQEANEQMFRTKFRPNIIYVPLYAFGGFLTGYRDTVFIDSLERFYLPGVMGEHYAFEISGMSMYKKGEELSASPGDIAISRLVENFSYLMKGKGYILQTVDGILYKTFEKLDEKNGYFKSLNEEYDGHKIPLKELKRIYFVDFIMKKTK